MKTIEEFLSYLCSLEIKLWVDGARLRCSAPEGTLTPSLLTQLQERKAEILAFLQKANLTSTSTLPPIVPVSREGKLPLSYAQQRMWFVQQLEVNSGFYNITAAVNLKGHIHNIAALEYSLNHIINRHEILRTNFVAVDGQPMQVIASNLTIKLGVVDLQHLEATQRESTRRQLGTEQVAQPFDLVTDPLVRASLFKLTETEYVLLLVMHHLVLDWWSMGLLVNELAAVYYAKCNNLAIALPELPIQYADFAVWQQQSLDREVLTKQLAYWQQQLAGAPGLLELPTDRSRPAIQTYRGAIEKFSLSKKLSEALAALSQKQGVTLFMTLLAAFQTLLFRYTDQTDICVGTPIANRHHSQTERLIGLFANTLVLRSNLSGNPSFSDLLSQVREVALGAYAHQDLPFEQLVKQLQPERSLSHTPLFQVMFTLQAPLSELQFPGLTASPLTTESFTAKFDLTLVVENTNAGLVGVIEYNTDLFDATTIIRMARHYQNLLAAVVVNPAQQVSDMPLLSAAEQHQLLVEWNNTQADYPKQSCLHSLFEQQVEKTPDAVAVVFVDERLTYSALNAKANQLAHYLQTLGVGADVLVGICIERSLEMIVGLLGILKAGGAYVPLDPTYPQDRLAYMLSDSRVSVLLTQEKLVADLPKQAAHVVCLDSQWGIINRESQENPLSTVQHTDLSYVIYTSGSTGKPKGVLIAHQGLCNLAQAQIRLFDINSNSSVLQFASLSFDASISEIVIALCSGGRLCLGTKDSLLPGPNLMQFLRTYKITHVTLPPSALAVLPYEELPALRTIIVAGEQASPDLVAQWSKDRRFFNAYGPTESTVCATVAECTDTSNQISIGRPIANTQIYILDSHLQPVPIGVRGELYIGGTGLARDYLNRSELTQEKFIVNPFRENKEQGSLSRGTQEKLQQSFPSASSEWLYKTGDLARYLPNGNIEFLGRIDYQVKIRGFRIELGEIEAVLSQYSSVKQVVVIDREDVPGDKRLVAYIVHDQEQVPKVSELRSLLKEKLPNYMMPSGFVMLEAIPLTPNGKVNRKALPAPDTIRTHLEETFVTPRTPTEEVLAEIWTEVLRLKQVDVHDNFFDLGGHSLATTQLLFRIQNTFNVELPLHTLLQTPTLAGMASAIDLVRQVKPTSSATISVTDLSAETILDETIRPAGIPFEYVAQPARIFLTGATGFLGAFLLYELLQQTDADICCLVRTSNTAEGFKKIQANLESYSLWNECFSSRIISVVGDLSEPLFGLGDQEFQLFAGTIDVIYHNGALVNFVEPYSKLKTANVLGTQEVLRLASKIKVKPIHYISTLSVFPWEEDFSGEHIFRENDSLDRGSLVGGYEQSKWVAEKLITIAHTRGLPVSIYRPGRVSGHSQTGICNTDDLMSKMIKGYIQLGSVPDINITVDLTPVDYASKSIIYLSRQTKSLGETFHILNPYPADWNSVITWVRSFGYLLKVVSYNQWRTQLLKVAEYSPEHPLYPMIHTFTEEDDKSVKVHFDCQNTLNGLAGTSIICPEVSAELLSTYFSYYIHTGFIEAPRKIAQFQ